jgi:hypothetical protein
LSPPMIGVSYFAAQRSGPVCRRSEMPVSRSGAVARADFAAAISVESTPRASRLWERRRRMRQPLGAGNRSRKTGYSSPRSANETASPPAMQMWSRRRMSTTATASQRQRVISSSTWDGFETPDGWSWATSTAPGSWRVPASRLPRMDGRRVDRAPEQLRESDRPVPRDEE